MRYLLQESKNKDRWVCTDEKNGLVCVWKHQHFNETQVFTQLEDMDISAWELSKLIREMTDWIAKNHYEKAMK